MPMLYSKDAMRQEIKEGPREDNWFSLGRGHRNAVEGRWREEAR